MLQSWGAFAIDGRETVETLVKEKLRASNAISAIAIVQNFELSIRYQRV